ncbi:MAG: D-tyrosyl-tRNA(Tyr) deacylase [Clostridia bacterium]|nr:D-tyrosyl-tRNA(Tyr) deacylase [Clostridia bacterium]
MKAVIQRVAGASVTVEKETVSSVEHGLLVYLGITSSDTDQDAAKMVDKIVHLRIFDDENGVPNRSVLDVNGQVMLVSQFTLYADASHGRRPSYIKAAPSETAEPLYLFTLNELRRHVPTECGVFGAHMEISSVNDGPFTILLEI